MTVRVKNKVLELIQQRELAENRRIPIAEIARESGVPRATVHFWIETPYVAKFDSATVARFCAYFGCELSDLLELEPEGVDA